MKDDTILRQAAVEALYDWELSYTWDEHCKEEHDSPYIISPSKIIGGLPPAQPEPRWIPVTEQTLPRENEQDEDGIQQYYLIQNEFGDMMVAAYRGNNSGYTWWEQMYTYKPIEDKVVAYMSLPKPYERSEHADS